MNPLKWPKALAALRRGDWTYGLPHCPSSQVEDPRVLDAISLGRESIFQHRRRLDESAPTKSGKHAKAEEGR